MTQDRPQSMDDQTTIRETGRQQALESEGSGRLMGAWGPVEQNSHRHPALKMPPKHKNLGFNCEPNALPQLLAWKKPACHCSGY